MEQFLKTLFSLSLAGTALALLLMLLGRVLRGRVSSRFVYLAWLLVLLRFILPAPGLLSVPSAAPIVHAPVEMTAPGSGEGLPGRSYRDGMNPSPGGMAPAEPQSIYGDGGAEDAMYAVDSGEETQVSAESERAPFPVWTALFWIWAAGAACAAAWNLGGYFRYRRALYRTLRPVGELEMVHLNALHPRPWPVLWRSGAVSTPLLMGLLRPVIILPDRAYTPEMLEGILRHELTHYRRGDLIVKWLAAAVFCVHWFNPVVYLLRGEIDRDCELSCDERLLRDMDLREKQAYGELLLTLAANQPLPRRVVATSFATEKRNLKERLIQIMTFKKKGWAAFTVMLVVLALLVGCAVAMGPAAVSDDREEMLSAHVQYEGGGRQPPVPVGQPEDSTDGGNETEYYVDSVDAFLAALGSDRTLVLAAGEYNLTQAAGYGGPGTENYSWAEVGDGYELVLDRLENLTILGEDGAVFVNIVTEPRYANVLRFEDCRSLTLDGVTAGHTPDQGYCTGGVLSFSGCSGMYINGCVLYGCGTIGIIAKNCREVIAQQTTIKECSYGAIRADNCYDVRFTNGLIHDCGLESQNFNLIESNENTGFVVFNTEIYNNDARLFLSSDYSAGVELRGCHVYNNQFGEGMRISGSSHGVRIDGCTLNNNALVTGLWYADPGHPAVDWHYRELSVEALMAMEWSDYQGVYDGPTVPEPPELSYVTGEDGRREYHVTTVDEFLAAIGSDRTICLDAERLELSAAEGYGGYGGTHYYWQGTEDGPELVITGVINMKIAGMGKDKTTVETLPRYADVLSFVDCYAVTVQDLTAGHTPEAGACTGDVISFQDCGDCKIVDCGLFGCGVNGINAYECQNLEIRDTEIYECSGYGAIIQDCYETVFDGCSIHDCAYDMVRVGGDGTATWDGERLKQ